MEAENDGRMGETMTDEERKKLCDYLRYPTGRHDADILDRLCKEAEKAADEIERLAALVQSDAEPVAWRWRHKDQPEWHYTDRDVGRRNDLLISQPLYTAPPRPDASAGLIKEIEELQRENETLRAITRGARKADEGVIS